MALQILTLSRIISACEERFAERGLRIRQVVGEHEIVSLIADLEKPYITPQLDPGRHDFLQDQVFWLAVEENGSPVAGVGLRFDNLGAERLASYWRRACRRLYGEKGEIIPDRHPPIVERMKGGLVYFGDLYAKPKFQGRRIPLSALIMTGYCLSAMQWEVEWFYAFIRKRHADAGYAQKYLATGCAPCVHLWRDPPDQRDDSDYLITLPIEDFEFEAILTLDRPDVFGIVKDKLDVTIGISDGQEEPVESD